MQGKESLILQAQNRDRRDVFSRFGRNPSASFGELFIRSVFQAAAYLTIAVTVTIIFILLKDAYFFFEQVSVIDYLTGTEWQPFGFEKKFGILPLLSGTLMVAAGASLVAVPLGLGTAVFLTQYASKRVREVLTPLIEILGGIPTVVYGYFAIVTVTPALGLLFPGIEVFNALSASIVVGIGILPMVSSLSADSLRLVPSSLKNAGFALGMSRFHVVTRITIPAAFSGIMASFILAFARAIGETMAVTLAAGATPNMSWNYLEGIQTMTAYIVQVSLGDTAVGSIEYYTRYAIGLTLFLLTFGFNAIATRIAGRYREEYQ